MGADDEGEHEQGVSEQEHDDETPGAEIISLHGGTVVPYDEDDWLPVRQPVRITTTNVLDVRVIPSKAEVVQWIDQTRNGFAWRRHKWGVHTLRAPLYLGRALRSAPRGLWLCLLWWLEWVRDLEGLAVRRGTQNDHSQGGIKISAEYRKASEDHRSNMIWRSFGSVVGLALLALLARAALHRYPPVLCFAVVLAVLCALGWYGSAPGTIITIVDQPHEGVRTGEEVIQAFMYAGITTPLTTTGKGTGPSRILIPPHRDGTGYTCDVDLPPGVAVKSVMDKLDRLASALWTPEDCLEIDPLKRMAAGRIRLFVALVHPLDQDIPPWPLMNAEKWSVFKPLPVGVDSRGGLVTIMLMFAHTLIGALPQRGKTSILRLVCCAVLLDPHADLVIVDFGGAVDYLPFEPYCLEFISGPEVENIERFARFLDWCEQEYERRMRILRAAGPKGAPEGRITEALARKGLRPIIVPVDEFHIATMHPRLGAGIVRKWGEMQRILPKVGIDFVEATQTADQEAVPTELRNIAGQRIALTLPTWQASNAVLGGDAQAQGLDASDLGGEPGYGIAYGVDTKEHRAHRGRVRFFNVTLADSEQFCDSLAGFRKQPRAATVETTVTDEGHLPAIARAVLSVWPADADRAHLQTLAESLGLTKEMLAAGLRQAKIPTRQVKIGGVNLTGLIRSDLEPGAADGAV